MSTTTAVSSYTARLPPGGTASIAATSPAATPQLAASRSSALLDSCLGSIKKRQQSQV